MGAAFIGGYAGASAALLFLRLGVGAALAARRHISGHVFGDHGAVELRHRALGQALPDLVHAKERNAEIAAQRERLAIGTECHDRAVDLAVARIDDGAVLVFEALPLHAANQRKTQQGRVFAVVLAAAADLVGIFAR